MHGQHKTLIPSTLNHITLIFHQINNTQFKLLTQFSAIIYDNGVDWQKIPLILKNVGRV